MNFKITSTTLNKVNIEEKQLDQIISDISEMTTNLAEATRGSTEIQTLQIYAIKSSILLNEIRQAKTELLKFNKLDETIVNSNFLEFQYRATYLQGLLLKGYALIHQYSEHITGKSIGYLFAVSVENSSSKKEQVLTQLSLEEIIKLTKLNITSTNKNNGEFKLQINNMEQLKALAEKMSLKSNAYNPDKDPAKIIFDIHDSIMKQGAAIAQRTNSKYKNVYNAGYALEAALSLYKKGYEKLNRRSSSIRKIIANEYKEFKNNHIAGWKEGDYEISEEDKLNFILRDTQVHSLQVKFIKVKEDSPGAQLMLASSIENLLDTIQLFAQLATDKDNDRIKQIIEIILFDPKTPNNQYSKIREVIKEVFNNSNMVEEEIRKSIGQKIT